MNSIPTRLLAAFACSLLAVACTSNQPRGPQVVKAEQRATPWQQPTSKGNEPGVLYARDGSVIGGPGQGTVTINDGPASREVGADSGSRMYLLERFQETVEENESLQFEVQGLAAALDQAEAKAAQLEKDLSELQARYLAQETESAKLKSDNLALADHLTTAQIRRLQAEKLLIEAKIDWQRVQRMTDVTAQAELPTEASAGRTAPGKAKE